MNARLADRPLKRKPRIVVTTHGFYSVERLNPYVPGSETYTATSFPEAVGKALEWAGPK